jgi:glycosyltransferase involved in cell wall biosynthesis
VEVGRKALSAPQGEILVRDDQGAPRNERCLVVFADDWGRHPSSCQHLVRELLDSCQVAWINTIGTRALSFDFELMRKGAQKLMQWGSSNKAVPGAAGPAPAVHNPLMYPGFRTRWQRRLNARLLADYLNRKLPRLRDSVVLSTVPITADLPAHVDAKRWVYYCVDDFSAWPGLDAQPLRSMEQELVSRADRIVTAGDNLATRIAAMGKASQVISHGIDLRQWTRTDGDAAMLAGLPRPIVLFWGLVDRRLDIEAIGELDRRMSSGCIALVGPQQDPDPRLARFSRVRLLGQSRYEDLPALARAAAVLVMPYADLPVTRAMQPLKMKEYLATGRPVVVSSLPAVADWHDCMDVAGDPREFAARVLERLDGQLPDSQRQARTRLVDESWRAKAGRFADILFKD